jgi:hypothetical protein
MAQINSMKSNYELIRIDNWYATDSSSISGLIRSAVDSTIITNNSYVLIPNLGVRVLTDWKGAFEIKVAPGTYSIIIESSESDNFEITSISCSPNERLYLTINLLKK